MLAARTGLSPVMVGRAAELARLGELAATTGEPALALVSGEAGIGKTRLVAELVATLDPAAAVLAAQHDLALLLVGTFRPEGVTRRHPLVDLLEELERRRVVATITLDRLDRAGVAELLGAVYRHPVPFQVAEACTGGPAATRFSWRS
jgi:predicted ATPase